MMPFSARATRQFQEQVQAAQPGTRFIELGERPQLLAAVGARQLDAVSLRKIGDKYGVAAVFVGDLAYSEPRVDVKISEERAFPSTERKEGKGLGYGYVDSGHARFDSLPKLATCPA